MEALVRAKDRGVVLSAISRTSTLCESASGIERLAQAGVPIWNSEDLSLVSSSEVAAAYAAHWRERLAVSVRFDRRNDWCRASSAAMR
jgi:hypothetical protein